MTEDPAHDDAAARKRRPIVRIVAVALLAIVALILVLQNTDEVETRLLFATVVMPRAVLLVITFLLGVIVGLLMSFLRKLKK